MIKYDSCIRCESKNIEKLMINTAFRMNYPPQKAQYPFAEKQRVIQPTNALVCNECGHVELFIDWDKL